MIGSHRPTIGSHRPTVSEPHWVTLGERVVHDGWVRVLERDYLLPDGRTATWELRAAGDSVGVLPLTPDGQIVLVREFRPGPDRRIISIPGGLVEPGETPGAAAVRELREETGFEAESLEVVATVVQGSSTQRQFAAVARGCRRVGDQQLDTYEDCEVLVVPPMELLRLLRAGEMSGTQLIWPALDAAGLL